MRDTLNARDFWLLVANWFPMLLLVAVWIFFMLHFRRVGKPAQQQALEEQKRHNDTLEKILASDEARLQKIGRKGRLA